MKLKATSLLETVVSSLIFLIVFGVAMGAASHINRISHPDWAEMEKDFNAYRDSIRTVDAGRYEYGCSWGKLLFETVKKEEPEGLAEISMTATMRGGQKIVYQYFEDE